MTVRIKWIPGYLALSIGPRRKGSINNDPWTARRSNQSIIKEISPEYSLEELMLKLRLQYFGHLMRTDSLEKTLMLGKIEGKRRRGRQKMRQLNSITDWMDVSLSKLQEKWRTGKPGVLQSLGLQRVGHNSATEQQHDLPLFRYWQDTKFIHYTTCST